MDIKLSRMGKFLSCEKFPECDGALTIEGKELKADEPLGEDPETGLPVLLLDGRFGPYVQIGNKETLKKGEKPRRASVPKEKAIEDVKLEDALKYLSLPRVLGNHPETGEPISTSIGRFGPFVVHQTDFRSLKEDNPYDITFERALTIIKEPKKKRGAKKKKKKKRVTKK